MHLRDVTIHASEGLAEKYKDGFVGKFARDVECVNVLFLKLIDRKITTDGTKKLALMFTDNSDELIERHHLYPEQPDVLIFNWLFPFADYVGAAESDKKRLIFTALCDCATYLARQYQWETQPLDEARMEAELQHFECSGYVKPSWISPDSKWRVKVYYDFGLEFLKFYACLFRNRSKTELNRQYLGKVVPVQGCNRVGKSHGKWLSSTQFEMISPSFFRKQWVSDFSEAIIEHS
ncbi:MAG: hypothetical protein ACIAZJ_17885 [Gimesia chilikensis]|uniref:hypothetical protein n=1 Tax=Gimesia chilikensis TaxID=2605989 RepID=UPI0037956D9A